MGSDVSGGNASFSWTRPMIGWPRGWGSLAPVWWERDWSGVRTVQVAIDPEGAEWLRSARRVVGEWAAGRPGLEVVWRLDDPSAEDPAWVAADEVLDLRNPEDLPVGLEPAEAMANLLGWPRERGREVLPGPVHARARPGRPWREVLEEAVLSSGGKAPLRILDRGGWLPAWVRGCRGVELLREGPLRLRWEGSPFCWHSLSIINRELCLRLLERGHELSLVPYEPDHFDPLQDGRFAPLAERVGARLSGPAEVHLRHRWPPVWHAPQEGAWAMIQPWEFGGAPRTWVDAVRGEVDAMVVPTSYVREGYVASGMPSERVHVVPNGVDGTRFHPDVEAWDLPGTRGVVFLFVGGSIPRKGVDILLEAWALAFTDADDVSLVIKDLGGKGVYRGQTAAGSIAGEACRLGAAPILHLVEEVPDERVPGIYTAADVLVHPYRGEGFGMPIAEAMACGLPVIVTGAGAALDFVDEEVGWLIPARMLATRLPDDLPPSAEPFVLAEPDPVALARLLREAAAAAGERKRRGAAGRQRILSSFSWDVVVDRLESLLWGLAAAPVAREEKGDASELPHVHVEGLEGKGEVWLPRFGDRSWERALGLRLREESGPPLVIWFDREEGWSEDLALERLNLVFSRVGLDPDAVPDLHVVVESAAAEGWRGVHDERLPVGPPGPVVRGR